MRLGWLSLIESEFKFRVYSTSLILDRRSWKLEVEEREGEKDCELWKGVDHK